jgi:limonene-1,2-epoxide hydrolase
MDAAEIVTNFCRDWPGMSPAEMAGFFAEDCTYENFGLREPLRGSHFVAGALEIFRARFEQIESKMLHVSCDGETVLSLRRESFWLPGGRVLHLEAMASIEVKDGKITTWKDYCDIQRFRREVDLTES